jgi:uncharacterized protein YndB with AHSA1/START domain
MHGTYLTIDQRPALRFERRIGHPIEAVWEAITEPGQLAQWFPCTVEVDLRVGGQMTFTFLQQQLPDESSTMTGQVTDLDPPRLFAFDWGPDHLRFELDPLADDACTLRFTVLIDADEKAARDAAGWHVCLDALERVLDGDQGDATHGVTDSWLERYEDYVERGLPSGAPIPEL